MKIDIKKIFMFLIILVLLFLLFEIIKTISFTKKVSTAKEVHMYSVITIDEKIKKKDLKNIPIGYYEEDETSTNYNSKYKYIGYKDIDSLYKGLMYGEVSAIIIDDNLRLLMESLDHKYKTNIIDTYKYTIKVSNVSKNIDLTTKTFNLYISGIDTFGDIKNTSRSDVNILATINPVKHKILLISIPRDYYINMPSKGKKDKLTHICIYGMDESIKALENLFDTDINYYVKVNFTSLVDLVDMLGGINVYSFNSFTSLDGYKYNVGYNKMNGNEVLSFVRERYSFPDGDITRGINEEEVIKSLINEFVSTKVMLKYDSFLDKLSNKIETNMQESEIISLIKLQIKDKIKYDISTYNLNGDNSYEYTYTYPNEKLYVMLPDKNMVETAKQKINEIGG